MQKWKPPHTDKRSREGTKDEAADEIIDKIITSFKSFGFIFKM
jgi:hypothetical protein